MSSLYHACIKFSFKSYMRNNLTTAQNVYQICMCMYNTCMYGSCTIHVWMAHESAFEPLHDKFMLNRNPYMQIKQLGVANEILLKFAIFLISYVKLYLVLLPFPFPCMLDIMNTMLEQRLPRTFLKKILRKLCIYFFKINTGYIFRQTWPCISCLFAKKQHLWTFSSFYGQLCKKKTDKLCYVTCEKYNAFFFIRI